MRLELRAVSHHYGDLHVLDGIDLVVRDGELLALIGPSGCGKSTLLGILGGLLHPSAGQVLQSGNPPADCLNPMTYVFQDFALLPWLTVEANIELPLLHHGLDVGERRARLDDVLARTRLSEFRSAYPKQLSGGMRQRVGLARALVVRPAVLLLDEPLSALDAQTRELLTDDFLDLWSRERLAAVWVTHNLGEALRIAERVVVLSRRPGRIKTSVAVDLPLERRAGASGRAILAGLHEQLWQLIREEAARAEQEMLEAGA
jgi:NitT/TauT family transport system ATP-binding protein